MRYRVMMLALGCGLLASGCARAVEVKPLFPSSADLRVEAEPQPTDAIVTDPRADEAFRAEREAWGRRGWAAVARLCNWAKANGMTVSCEATAE